MVPTGGEPAVSVIVCAYADERWDDLAAAVAAVREQSRAAGEVIVAIDHNAALQARAERDLTGVRVVANTHAPGLSGARNSGIEAARGDVLVFLDDDAVAEPGWLEHLLAPYADPRIIAVGGAIIPAWDRGRPAAFPEEFDWVVGCTYRGMPLGRTPVRNMIGANMSFRREAFDAVGGFRDGIGRVGRRPVGCEETELCLRVHAAFPGRVVLYEPAARVRHRVTADRASLRYFRERCYSEGLSKALVTHYAGAARGLASERHYTLRTLPAAVSRGLLASLRGGDRAGAARAALVLAGLTLTTAGFLTGTAASALAARRGGARRTPAGDAGWLHLDVHGRVGIRVQADAAAAPQLRDMLAPFVASASDRCDLEIRGRLEAIDGLVAGDGDHRYRPGAVELQGGRLQVLADGDGYRLAGTGELLTPVLGLLDALAVRRRMAMVHAATVARDGRGVCLGAAGGAGKTSSTVGLVRDAGFDFMGDDWAFLADDGQVLGFAKPLFVRPHHQALFPHLFTGGQRRRMVPASFVGPLGRIATAAHPVISRHPALARKARRWWPEHMIVAPGDALPEASVARTAQLAAAIFVERAQLDAPRLVPRDPAWMASRLAGDFLAALPRGATDLQATLAATGLLAVDRMLAAKGEVLRRALADVPCLQLCLPERMRAEETAHVVAAQVEELLVSIPNAKVTHA
jgi:GT2 family glycosyltransferase